MDDPAVTDTVMKASVLRWHYLIYHLAGPDTGDLMSELMRTAVKGEDTAAGSSHKQGITGVGYSSERL